VQPAQASKTCGGLLFGPDLRRRRHAAPVRLPRPRPTPCFFASKGAALRHSDGARHCRQLLAHRRRGACERQPTLRRTVLLRPPRATPELGTATLRCGSRPPPTDACKLRATSRSMGRQLRPRQPCGLPVAPAPRDQLVRSAAARALAPPAVSISGNRVCGNPGASPAAQGCLRQIYRARRRDGEPCGLHRAERRRLLQKPAEQEPAELSRHRQLRQPPTHRHPAATFPSPQSCGGGGTTTFAAATAESNAHFCTRLQELCAFGQRRRHCGQPLANGELRQKHLPGQTRLRRRRHRQPPAAGTAENPVSGAPANERAAAPSAITDLAACCAPSTAAAARAARFAAPPASADGCGTVATSTTAAQTVTTPCRVIAHLPLDGDILAMPPSSNHGIGSRQRQELVRIKSGSAQPYCLPAPARVRPARLWSTRPPTSGSRRERCSSSTSTEQVDAADSRLSPQLHHPRRQRPPPAIDVLGGGQLSHVPDSST